MSDLSNANLDAVVDRLIEIRSAMMGYIRGAVIVVGQGDHDDRSLTNAVASLTMCLEWLLLMQSIRKIPTDIPSCDDQGTIPFSGR